MQEAKSFDFYMIACYAKTDGAVVWGKECHKDEFAGYWPLPILDPRVRRFLDRDVPFQFTDNLEHYGTRKRADKVCSVLNTRDYSFYCVVKKISCSVET